MNDVIKQMKSHTSIRKYKQEVISKENLYPILEAAQCAASSHFVQAYSVIHVTDKEKMQKIATLSKNAQIGTCGAFLVFCMDMKRLEVACHLHGKEIQADTTENLLVAAIDTALYAQNVALGCEASGYGICYIGGIRNQLEEISKLLEIPDKVVPLFGMSIGIPNEQHEVKPRLPLSAIVHENAYNEQKYPEILQSYDAQMREYYGGRGANKKDTDWTTGISTYLSEVRRGYITEFVKEKGFLLQ